MAMVKVKRYCPCVTSGCPRHGLCRECKTHHSTLNTQPMAFCQRLRKAREAQNQQA